MKKLNKKFVLTRISELPTIPISWGFKNVNEQNVFILDLRMCELNDLKQQCSYLFDSLKSQSGTNLTQNGQKASKIDLLSLDMKIFNSSDLILKVVCSLNNITTLKIQDLDPFAQLRCLDASLNRIESFSGIIACSQLTTLGLAYNNIREVPWKSLEECQHLNSIDFRSNFISTLKGFPVLPNLQTLNLSSNLLKTVDGIHLLQNLKELDVNTNQLENVVGISSCSSLNYVNASHNLISKVVDVVEVFRHLKQVRRLDLEENPVLESSKKELLGELIKLTNVKILNQINIIPLSENYLDFSGIEPPSSANSKKEKLKTAVREAMRQNLIQKQTENDAYVCYMYSKILALRNEMEQYKAKIDFDSNAWCGYIDTLSSQEAQALTVGRMQTLMQHSNGLQSITNQDKNAVKEAKKKPKYLQVKNPTEVLLAAAQELSTISKN